MRHLALGAEAADVVDAGRRGALDFRDRMLVEGRRIARRRVDRSGFRSPINTPRHCRYGNGRAGAPSRSGGTPTDRLRRAAGLIEQLAERPALCSSRIGFSMQSAPRLFTLPRTKRRAS